MSATQPELFQALTLKSGLRMYAKHGIKPNRMWTPKAMMDTAMRITGKKFKAREYEAAAVALMEWVEANAPKAAE